MEKGTEERIGQSTGLDQLPHEKWVELTRAVENRIAAPGTVIFKHGDPGDSFYIIRSGKVRIFRKDAHGLETEFSVLGAGQSFGEIALLTGEPRAATVEALEETHLMVLSREQFERALKDFPGITVALVKQLSGRLLVANGVIEHEAQQQYQSSRFSWFDVILLIGVSVILAIVFNRSNPNGIPLLPEMPDRKAIQPVTATQALEAIKKGGALLVDARPELFYEKKHIKGAVNVPLTLFDIVYAAAFPKEEKKKEVIVYGGTFSKLYDWEVASKLLQRAHRDVRVLEGGMAAWEKMGYPVEEEKGSP